ncbi:MAG: pyridoxamine 5'-phosphate oxidase family protein [Actinomycetota bacterium]
MASWQDVSAAAPELAAVVQERFDAHKHKVMATLRKDGSPRISGIEASFDDGELWLGGMWKSLKFIDLQRDPRMALHCAPVDPETSSSAGDLVDVKVAGNAVMVDPKSVARFAETDPESMHLAKVDVAEVVSIRIGDPADHLVIDSWNPDRGFRSVKRY